ncbi:hypothetical protein [Actinomadura sp. SCN-SB]|uniref:hypothetical protein n=1 Tax=Actinomadura sp. SCN-SB TaxID=3373092 RepID=UPI0037509EF5
MELPEGAPVPMATLSPVVRRRLAQAPQGVVTMADGFVTRRLVVPLTPLLAVVTSRSWDAGLLAASRFAAYCQRMVVVSKIPGDDREALRRAELYGIGVAIMRARRPEVVLEPEPVNDWEPTPAWWRFSEDIYAQVAPGRN